MFFSLTTSNLQKRLVRQFVGSVALMMFLSSLMVAIILAQTLWQEKKATYTALAHKDFLRLEQHLEVLLESSRQLSQNHFVIRGLNEKTDRAMQDLDKFLESYEDRRDLVSFTLSDFNSQPVCSYLGSAFIYDNSKLLRRSLAFGTVQWFLDQKLKRFVVISPVNDDVTTLGAIIVGYDLVSISKRLFSYQNQEYYRLTYKGTPWLNVTPIKWSKDFLSVHFSADKTMPTLEKLSLGLERGLPLSTFLSSTLSPMIQFVLLGIILTLVATLWASRIGRGLARPIAKLCNDVEQMDVNIQLKPLGTNDELENLVTAFNRRATTLQKQHTFLQTILNNVSDGIVACDHEGKLSLFNRATRKMHGKDVKKLPPSEWSQQYDLYAADGKTLLNDHEIPLYRAFNEEKVRDQMIVIAPKTGAKRFLLVNGQHMLDHKGEKIGAVVSMRDITEMYRLEKERERYQSQLEEQVKIRTQALSRSEAILQRAQEIAHLGYWRWQITADKLIWSEQTFQIFGLNHKKVQPSYRLFLKHIHPEDRQCVQQALKSTIRGTNSTYHINHRIIRSDGNIRYVQERGQIHKNAQGDHVEMVGTILDMTELKETETALERARFAAEEASRAKSSFLANMSHEIRTPMNAVINLCYLALQTQLTQKQRDYLKKIKASGKTLLNIINNILDVSKIEANKLEIHIAPFDLEGLLERLSNIAGMRNEHHRIEILFDVREDIPRHIIGDELRLEQVLTNLLSNAIKFTEQGHVILTLSLMHKKENNIHIQFRVQDSGIGMSHEQLEGLFQPFTQADNSITRRFGGTGLGLAISHKLVKIMGGNLAVESIPKQGSTFFFTLPFKINVQEQRQKICVSDDLPELSVLIVDDSALARRIMQRSLTALGISSDTAVSGEEALIRIETSLSEEGETGYDLVFMDWNLPGIDGIQTGQQIREIAKKTPKIVLIAAYDLDLVRRMSEQIQIDAFLLKPTSPAILLQTILSVMSLPDNRKKTHWFEPTIAALDKMRSLAGLHILLVEDNEINQMIAAELLEKMGIQTDIAYNGQEAIDKLRENPQTYDVILMDLQMPVMDGLEATRQIRKQPQFASLPIIAMTAHAMANERDRCFKIGMNAHLAKPIDPNELYTTLVQWIPAEKKVQLKNRDQSIVQSPVQIESDGVPQIDGIDTQRGIRALGGNQKLYYTLLRSFAQRHHNLAQEIKEAFAEKRKAQVEKLAHTIKGVAGNFGAMTLFNHASALEQWAKTAKTEEDGIQQFNLFLHSFEEILVAIRTTLDGETVSKKVKKDHPLTKLEKEHVLSDITRIQELLETDFAQVSKHYENLAQLLQDTHFENILSVIKHALRDFETDVVREQLDKLQSALS
ncbi:response regulator [Magnetococcales bacterium HHB-1]